MKIQERSASEGILGPMIAQGIEGIWQTAKCAVGLALGMVVWSGSGAQAELVVNTPNLSEATAMMEDRTEKEGRDMVGIVLPVQADFFELADRAISGGLEVWTLKVRAEGAVGVNVYFETFHVPAGGELYFSTPESKFEETWVNGPVTSIENNDHGRWVSRDVPGDEVVMTYRAPVGLTEAVTLHISDVGYFARHMRYPEPWASAIERGGADECQVNVNCPEGDSWECEKSAVVRLQITQNGGVYFCSGSMVNNTALDCRQLLLSSFHCVNDVDEDEWAFLQVRFNYQGAECASTSSSFAPQRTGVIHLGDSNDIAGNGNISGSDFVLVEVEDNIPDSWNPFFAGWDATGFGGNEGVGIHHPSGDLKKISSFSNSLSNSNAYAIGAHWRVTWSPTETNHGVTEGGSSGSPIFDENHRILGTLTGGASFCSSPYAPDYYGKMSYHWGGSNPTPASQKLNVLLDPSGTGEERLDGSYRNVAEDGTVTCDAFDACEATAVEEAFLSGLTVAPNPTTGRVDVHIPEGHVLMKVQVFDAMGRALEVREGAAVLGRLSLDLQAWGEGMRYLTLTSSEGWSTTRKVLVSGAK